MAIVMKIRNNKVIYLRGKAMRNVFPGGESHSEAIARFERARTCRRRGTTCARIRLNDQLYVQRTVD